MPDQWAIVDGLAGGVMSRQSPNSASGIAIQDAVVDRDGHFTLP